MDPGSGITVIGVCVVDVLGRPIESLPRGQGSHPIEQIEATVAGTAGGTAIDLARLGAEVRLIGAVGEDLLGELLALSLRREGVEAHLAPKPQAQTAATILPIHPDGTRPAWHVPGASRELGPEDVPGELLDSAGVVHYGGFTALPRLDGEPAAGLLRRARAAGALTTADCLGIKRADTDEPLAALLPEVDLFMPNRAEALALTGTTDVYDAARRLRRIGAGSVIVTCDADGCVIADEQGERTLPAFAAPVVDSTGCGDAFSAGVIMGLRQGWSLNRAATLGLACAALVLGRLGSVAGLDSLERTIEWMEQAEPARDDLEVS
jgi:sugar/nucleoside kinase (ribokinase family)